MYSCAIDYKYIIGTIFAVYSYTIYGYKRSAIVLKVSIKENK